VVSSADPAHRRTARSYLSPPVAGLVLAAALAGCVSTEQKAAWQHVEDARIIASQSATVVRRAGDQARVTRVSLLRGGSRLAIAVQLHNPAARAVNDLPISVGLSRGRTRSLLNRAAGLSYFQTHVAVIPARSSITWLFETRSPRPSAGRVFAVVGNEARPAITVASQLPQIDAAVKHTTHAAGRLRLRVQITNRSSIPQAELPVYALASSGDRLAAAGSATVGLLDGGASTTVDLGLIGRAGNARIELEVLPTLF
jgi:hypothetical protein